MQAAMNSKMFPTFLILLASSLFVLGCGGGKPKVDLGDSSLGNLMWGASQYGFIENKPDKALVYVDKAMELYGDEARQQQASLSDFPPTDPPEAAYEYKVLNGMGLMMLMKGGILEKQGDRAGAEENYNMVIQDFGYAQFEDNGEWGEEYKNMPRDDRGFLKVADVARMKLADLEAAGED
jgi:hypothetical protein